MYTINHCMYVRKKYCDQQYMMSTIHYRGPSIKQYTINFSVLRQE